MFSLSSREFAIIDVVDVPALVVRVCIEFSIGHKSKSGKNGGASFRKRVSK
jgi:hypothetical protein